jgi:WD40 repeat protein
MSKCTTVKLWDARTGKQQVNLPDLDGLYIPAALTRNNTRLVYGTVSGQFRLWDLTTNQAVMELPDLIPGANRIAVSDDGRIVAYRLADGSMRLLDTR